MNIEAIGFDVGHTLIQNNKPLNWKTLYAPALQNVAEICAFKISDLQIQNAIHVLMKYNTRENYREKEVSSDTIFHEIFSVWGKDYYNFPNAKGAFYSFFQTDTSYYDDTIDTLKKLKDVGIKLGALTDVAYGMDNEYSLKNIASAMEYFDVCLTSVDVGFRKPNGAGFKILLQKFAVNPSKMLFVGDEEKDIIGANQAGINSVLINRTPKTIDWRQSFTISSLSDLLTIVNTKV